MTKPKLTRKLLAIILFGVATTAIIAGLTLFTNRVPSELTEPLYKTAGIGVSDYEINVTITVGQTKTFEVARVSNEGTLGLTITTTWQTDNTGLTLKLYPETVHLNSGEATVVKGEVTNIKQAGTYKGTIEFTTTVDQQTGNGNPSTPAGTAHATFNVITP
jgi:DNA/RNA endonuclease YhcR with UshA esterase domain